MEVLVKDVVLIILHHISLLLLFFHFIFFFFKFLLVGGQISVLNQHVYTLNLHNVTHQLYLSKAEEKINNDNLLCIC